MNNSSAHTCCSTISIDDICFSSLSAIDTTDTITLTDTYNTTTFSNTCSTYTNCYSYSPTTSTITISGGSGYSIGGLTACQLGSITIPNIQGIFTKCEWEDTFPDWTRVQCMMSQYPGLKIAFEKFKTTYYLVKDDYDTPKDQRTKP